MNWKVKQKEEEKPIYQDFPSPENIIKNCPYCGEKLAPFTTVFHIYRHLVGKIQYLQNPQKFAKNHYSSVEVRDCNN